MGRLQACNRGGRLEDWPPNTCRYPRDKHDEDGKKKGQQAFGLPKRSLARHPQPDGLCKGELVLLQLPACRCRPLPAARRRSRSPFLGKGGV